MSWTHIEDTKPIARKRYQCVLCEGFIQPGDRYVARKGVHSGDPILTSRMHILCESLTRNWDHCDWESADAATFRNEVLKPALEKIF